MLLGPLGLQSQLIGHLEGLAQCQDDLIGQVLGGTGTRRQMRLRMVLFKIDAENLLRPSKRGYLFNTMQKKHCQRRYDTDTFKLDVLLV